MEEITYNHDCKEVQFSGKITSFKFYSHVFHALNEHYTANGPKIPPVLAFKGVDEYDSLVIPNLIGLGIMLKRKHEGRKIKLKFLRISSTQFLDNAMFFDNIGPTKIIEEEININNIVTRERFQVGLDVFEFEKENLGFYNNDVRLINYNNDHKTHVYKDISFSYYNNYSEIKDTNLLELKLDSIRTKISNQLKPRVETRYLNILKRYNRPEEEVNLLLRILTELICNSMLYSYSPAIALLQSKATNYYDVESKDFIVIRKTKISVSDTGIGFEGSFKSKPSFENCVTKDFENSYKNLFKEEYEEESKSKIKNYLLIFDGLHYSMVKDRENLFTLLKLVINYGGKLRIHYENVQVIFTSNRCLGCEMIPLKCAVCLLKNLNSDPIISPVRFFDYSFKGVHIEVEFDM